MLLLLFFICSSSYVSTLQIRNNSQGQVVESQDVIQVIFQNYAERLNPTQFEHQPEPQPSAIDVQGEKDETGHLIQIIFQNYVEPTNSTRYEKQPQPPLIPQPQPPAIECKCSRNMLPRISRVNSTNLTIVKLGSKYYHFSTTFKANYFLAQDFCTAHGMQLTNILNEEENALIISHLDTHYPNTVVFLTGGNDLATEGKFVWPPSNTPITYFDWHNGEPNNDFNNQNCLSIWKSGVFKWDDAVCSNSASFICEAYD